MEEEYHYVGFDIHKKTIAICVMDERGHIKEQRSIRSTPAGLKSWLTHEAPRRWKGGMEATLFTDWVYDVMHEYNEDIEVGNPMALKYISSMKRKNDRLDAKKMANLLRCDMFPGIHMLSKEMRMLRRLVRYRNFVVREITRFKNYTTTQLMGLGIEYNSRKIHGKKYFARLLKEVEIPEEALHILTMDRHAIDFLQGVERGIKRRLLSNEALCARLHRLLTIPGVGLITALSWSLEVGDPHRFPSLNKAVSYCGLCSAERESGGKVRRGPLSKHRNKHLQWVLLEASKLGVQHNPRLAEVYEKTYRHHNHNAATIAVARRMAAFLLALDKRNTVYDPAHSCSPPIKG